MYKNKKILALIPARGGSKGVLRKNIRPLSGKPLIAWTIEEAKNSRYIDRVIVSTDDMEIAEISKRYGAETPFLRPKELATDESRAIDVILHLVGWLEKNDDAYNILIYLQPTSPLRTAKDIDDAIELLLRKDALAVVSVSETEHHPNHANLLPPDGCMKDFVDPQVMNKNRQELKRFYRLNGAIYIVYFDHIKKERSFYGDRTFAYIMPKERSVDIDDKLDFIMAETLMKSRSGGN